MARVSITAKSWRIRSRGWPTAKFWRIRLLRLFELGTETPSSSSGWRLRLLSYRRGRLRPVSHFPRPAARGGRARKMGGVAEAILACQSPSPTAQGRWGQTQTAGLQFDDFGYVHKPACGAGNQLLVYQRQRPNSNPGGGFRTARKSTPDNRLHSPSRRKSFTQKKLQPPQ